MLYPSVVACFESIVNADYSEWTSDAIIDARALLSAMSSTDFISALVITNACLKHLYALTHSLQAEAKDIVEAVAEIQTVCAVLKDVRDKIDSNHTQWFRSVEQMCQVVNSQPQLPRISGRQHHRSNHPASSPSEYYRRTISIPLLDHLISEIDTRFSKHQQTAIQGLDLVPSVLVTYTTEDICGKLTELLICTLRIFLIHLLSRVSHCAGK